MNKLTLTLVIFALFIGLGIYCLGLPRQHALAQSSTLTPTATQIAHPFDYPDINNLMPDSQLVAVDSLRSKGYRVIFAPAEADGSQRIGVILAGDLLPDDDFTARISADLLVSDGKILEAYLSIDRLSKGLSHADWKLVDPMPIFRDFGAPNRLQATLIATDGGPLGGFVAIWDKHNIAVSYATEVTPRDLKPNDVNPTSYTICFSRDRFLQSSIWFASAEQDIRVVIEHPTPRRLNFGQPFSPTMFTNAPDLATFAQRLANGECLETPSEVWFK